MSYKEFHELTTPEATKLAKECVRGAKSVDEIKKHLQKAGFNIKNMASASWVTDSVFHASVVVCGPNNEYISELSTST